MTILRRLLLPLSLLLPLLCACGPSHRERLQQLETLEARNSADSLMTDDSLATVLAEFFDDHGTPNERMRAHYILGRTYADRGEAPAALEAYLDAAASADTTAADCDWAKLSRVYGQMSAVFYDQNLMDRYLACNDCAIDYAWRAKDTLQALAETAYKVIGHERMQQYDKAASLYAAIYNQMKEHFGVSVASRYSIAALKSCLETSRIDEVHSYLNDIYRYSGYLDSTMNAAEDMEIYYYYFGEYYRRIGLRDSAEFFFRKELEQGLDFNNQNAAAHGLSLLYESVGQYDSASKYAIYSYAMNDSAYALMTAQTLAHALASYDYTRSKEQAVKESVRAEKERVRSRRLLLILACTATLALLIIWRQKRRAVTARQKLVALQEALLNSLNDVLHLRSHAAALKDYISEMETEIRQKSEEEEKLHRLEATLHDTIREKEEKINLLQAAYTELQSQSHVSKADAEASLKQSQQYEKLREKEIHGSLLMQDELHNLHMLVMSSLPAFFRFISSNRLALNEREYNLCMLLRLHVKPLSVANLLGVKPSVVTRTSKDVLRKVFKKEGNTRDLAAELQKYC